MDELISLYEIEQDINNFYGIDTINESYNQLLLHKRKVEELLIKVNERLDLIANGEKVYVIMQSPYNKDIHVFLCCKEMIDKEWFQCGELVESENFKGKNADGRKEKFLSEMKEKYNIYAIIDQDGKILEKYQPPENHRSDIK